ncbi:MAG: rod-binding protein [Spirochaetales bacterium]|nr:rod-binding protein [Spirochaetales bacterium]
MITSPVDMDTLTSHLGVQRASRMRVESQDDKKLLETCKEFESIFVKQMLNSMKSTINKSGLIKSSMAEGIFEDMLYEKYAQKISRNGGLGIGEMIYKQLSDRLDTTKPSQIP